MARLFFYAGLIALVAAPQLSRCQEISQIPVMSVPVSAEANGMGGVSGSVLSDNSMATISNPAQLGIFTLHNIFNAGTYLMSTPYSDGFSGYDITLTASSLNLGTSFGEEIGLPFDFSLGGGYSRLNLDENSGYTHILDWWEHEDNYTIAIGFKWFASLGLGYTRSTLNSEIHNWGPTENVNTASSNYGVILEVPVFDFLSLVRGEELSISGKIKPVLDFTLASAIRNVGSDTLLMTPYGASNLPREAMLGLNLNFKLRTIFNGRPWDVFSFIWAREAGDNLTQVNSYIDPFSGIVRYQPRYRNGLGNISFLDNLVYGRNDGNVDLKKGWQVQVAEFVYVRGGSFQGEILPGYTTFGIGLRLNGMVELLAACNLVDADDDVFGFLLDHVDLQYDHAEYTSATNPVVSGTSFSTINVVFK